MDNFLIVCADSGASVLRRMVIAAGSIALVGCLALPVHGDGEPNIPEETIATIEQGVTSRDEVLALIGDPHAIWEKERVYIYNEGASSRLFFLVGGGYSAAAGLVDFGGDDIIVLQFDEDWRVCGLARLVAPVQPDRFGAFLRDWVLEARAEPGARSCQNEDTATTAEHIVDGDEPLQSQDRDEKILLFRVVPVADNTEFPAFPSGWPAGTDWIGAGLGSFDTGGRIEILNARRFEFLSDEARAMGWTYLVVAPGNAYLTFLPARRADLFSYNAELESSQPYRVEIPSGGPDVIYAGTVKLRGTSGRCLFGSSCSYFDKLEELEIVNESNDAADILRANMPGFGSLSISLLNRHDGPLILSTGE